MPGSSFVYIDSAKAIGGAGSAFPNTSATPINSTGGNLSVGTNIGVGSVAAFAFSDNSSNTFTLATDTPIAPSTVDSSIEYYQGSNGFGSGYYWTGQTFYGVMFGAMFSGAATSSVLNTTNYSLTNSATSLSCSVTTTTDGCLLYAICRGEDPSTHAAATLDSASIAAGWILVQSIAGSPGVYVGGSIAYKICAGQQTETVTFNLGGTTSCEIAVAAFKPASYTPSGSAGTIGINIGVSGVGAETAASTGTIGIAIGVAGVGAETAASTGTVGIQVGVVGAGSSTSGGTSTGTIGLNIGVAGVGAQTDAATGTIGIAVGVAGVGQAAQNVSAAGTIGLQIDVAGVSAGAANTGGHWLSPKQIKALKKKQLKEEKAREAAWKKRQEEANELSGEIRELLNPPKATPLVIDEPEDDDEDEDLELLLLHS